MKHENTSDNEHWSNVSRREFVGIGSLGLLELLAQRDALGAGASARLMDPLQPIVFHARRASDLMSIHVELLNLMPVRHYICEPGMLEERYETLLHIASHADSAFVVVTLGGQHIAEQAIWDRPVLPAGKDQNEVSDKLSRKPTHYLDERVSSAEADSDVDFLKRGRVWNSSDRAPQGKGNDSYYLKKHVALREGGVEKNTIIAGKEVAEVWNPHVLQGVSGAWISGGSQLVFELGQEYAPLPIDLDFLLELCAAELPMVVDGRLDPNFGKDSVLPSRKAQQMSMPYVGRHEGRESVPSTKIEFPSLLYISPYENARWSLRPSSWGGRSELWSIDLAKPDLTLSGSGSPRKRKLQGHMFAFDFEEQTKSQWPRTPDDLTGKGQNEKAKYDDFEAPKVGLYEATRKLAVKQMREDNGDITANDFRLTSIGATARLRYRPSIIIPPDEVSRESITVKQPVDKEKGEGGVAFLDFKESKDVSGFLTEWIQKTEIGRDYYVKEAFAGTWFPFQFEGEVVTITERKFCAEQKHNPTPLNKDSRPRIPFSGDTNSHSVVEEESELSAILVARKFGVLKRRIREFGGPESDDFDDFGAMMARQMGWRKVEVLVDRTPTLSNKGAGNKGQTKDQKLSAVKAGKDIAFANGSNGVDASMETFWPRVATPGKLPDGRIGRELGLYRFPVKITFIDGKEETTSMPMLFSSEFLAGSLYYSVSPERYRSIPLNRKITLTNPRPAGALNAGDLSADDAAALAQHMVKEGGALTGKAGELWAGDGTTPFAPGQAHLLAQSVTSLLGGVREELFRHVEQYKEYAKSWVDKNITSLSSLEDQMVRHLAKGVSEQKVRKIAQSIIRKVAWGEDSLDGIDAGYAAKRLGTIMDILESRGRALEKVKFYDAVKDKFEGQVQKKYPKLASYLNELLGVLTEEFKVQKKKIEQGPGKELIEIRALVASVPRLQVQWVAKLGEEWNRSDWDAWFAEFVSTVESFTFADQSKNDKLLNSTFKRAVTGALQKFHFVQLCDPNTLVKSLPWIEKGQNITEELRKAALTPLKSVETFSEKVDGLGKQIEGSFQAIVDDCTGSGLEGLERVLAGIEKSLPDERMLRQRVSWLIEDYEDLKSQGEQGIREIEDEVRDILDDAKTQLAHLTAHADDGLQRAKVFLEETSRSVEEVQQRISGFENEAKDFLKTKTEKFKALKGNEAEKVKKKFTKQLLESPPAKALRDFESLIEETGGKVVKEVEEQLGGIRELVQRVFEEAEGRIVEIEKLEQAIENEATAEVVRIRKLIYQNRQKMERLFAEVKGTIDPYRGMIQSLLIDAEKGIVSKIEDLNLGELSLAALFEEKKALSWRLANRLTDILRKARSNPKIPKNVAKELGKVEARIDSSVAQFWSFTEAEYNSVVAVLEKNASLLQGELLEDFQSVKGLIDLEISKFNEFAADVEKSIWRRMDAVELFALSLLSEGEAKFREVLGEIFEPISGVKGLLNELEQKWEKMLPDLNAIKAKLGESIPDLSEVEKQFSAELNAIEKELGGALEGISNMFDERAKHLEGAALNLLNKGKLALNCPSMVKSFQDHSTRAMYEVGQVTLSMQQAIGSIEGEVSAQVDHFLADARTAIGFPKVDFSTVTIDGVPVEQAITFGEEYIEKGFRSLKGISEAYQKEAEQVAAGAFATLKQFTGIAAVESGMASFSARIDLISREYGELTKELEAKCRDLENIGKNIKNAIAAEVDSLKAKVKGELEDAKDRYKAEVKELLPTEVSKLFGVLDFKLILKIVADPSNAPQLLANQYPDKVIQTYNWSNEADEIDLGLLTFVPGEGNSLGQSGPTKLSLTSSATIWLPKPKQSLRKPDYLVRGDLGAFSLTIGQMLKLYFESVSFTVDNGKFDFNPMLGASEDGEFMEFIGVLEFVNTVRDVLKDLLDDSSGPYVRIESDSILAGYQMPLPNLSFGAMSIDNIRLIMALTLPLKSGDLAYRFQISDRWKPFRISVSGFAGGGYLGVQLSTDENLCWVEGALEFGGALSFNVGVASGGVYLMAGLYFRFGPAGTIFTGYVRAGGDVRVLGIITVSLMFYLGLSYRKIGGATQAYGECTLSIRIKIGFFKRTVRVTMEKQFAGADSSTLDGSEYEGYASGNTIGSSGSLAAMLLPVSTSGLMRVDGSGGSATPETFECLFPDEEGWECYWGAFA